ncbi:uncharacterized protein [Dysidea avara]|uniref:uncharacterized protein n=1 Tax=Dysidea avara TaxID=196820 RepID=UPI0033262531
MSGDKQNQQAVLNTKWGQPIDIYDTMGVIESMQKTAENVKGDVEMKLGVINPFVFYKAIKYKQKKLGTTNKIILQVCNTPRYVEVKVQDNSDDTQTVIESHFVTRAEFTDDD